MYDVNGLPSTVTSTRRSASRATTSTRGAWACPTTGRPSPSSTQTLRMGASTHHDVLLAVVEYDVPPRMHRGDGHAQRDGVAVTGVDVRVRLPARAHALHPVPHVCRGGGIAAGVGGGLRRRHLGEFHRGQLIRLHAHLG